MYYPKTFSLESIFTSKEVGMYHDLNTRQILSSEENKIVKNNSPTCSNAFTCFNSDKEHYVSFTSLGHCDSRKYIILG